ncbi:MAG: 3-dehydroquinate synthase [Ignavibacteriae bacterium]|nr:3-dehydroquinate synthase [Ignavibacteriota bacterium]
MSSTVRVHLKGVVDNSYDIVIGTSLRQALRDIANDFRDASKFIITDSNVKSHYGGIFNNKLFRILTVPAGERSKDRKTKEYLEDRLLSLRADRNSLIIALGGGVIGDLAGFVAATFMRGIPYIQIPTTLLAQVDSSIGGKVAINHPLGKNLIGAFYQPKKVYIDTGTLKTLPEKEFPNGMAEVIKYGAILDIQLFNFLEKNHKQILKRDRSSLTRIIKRCCQLKKMIVHQDERETGLRRILNFGHTVGHAIEALSNYRIGHGEAIAMGMVAEAKLSYALGMINYDDITRLSRLLQAYGLPITIPSRFTLKQLLRATLHDKKIKQGTVQYTLLEKIGKAKVGVQLTLKEVEQHLNR